MFTWFCNRSVYSVGCGLGWKIGYGTKNDEKQPRLIEQFQTLNLQPMVVGRDDRVRTWGWGRYGCFGHGNEDCDSVPKVVESLSNVKVVHVATRDYTIFVISNGGDVYTFGCGESSSLGHNTAEVDAQDHMGAKDCCLMGLRKKRCGASCNEGFEVLFIVKIIKEAKIAYGSVMGHVEQLGGDVLKLHDES
ncbi:ultraviolet-B receptor UVR8 [Tanacetum coccineum]